MENEMKDMNMTYTVDQTARILGLSRNGTYALVREGKIPALRLGKRILIPRRKLERMLSDDQQTSAEARPQ